MAPQGTTCSESKNHCLVQLFLFLTEERGQQNYLTFRACASQKCEKDEK